MLSSQAQSRSMALPLKSRRCSACLPLGQVVLLERDEEADDANAPQGGGLADTLPRGRARQVWEWSVAGMHREHTHDVYALAIHAQSLDGEVGDGGVGAARKGPVLISGGLDTSLSLYSVPAFKEKVTNQLPGCLRPFSIGLLTQAVVRASKPVSLSPHPP